MNGTFGNFNLTGIIEDFYPLVKEYSEDKFPSNKSLKKLTELCRQALENYHQWENFLQRLKIAYPQAEILDSTLLIASEPSYFCTIYFPRKRFFYNVAVSVLGPFYTTINTSSLNDTGIEDVVKRAVEESFIGFHFLPYDLCKVTVPTVVVPSKLVSIFPDPPPPTIAECIFGPRSLSPTLPDEFWD